MVNFGTSSFTSRLRPLLLPVALLPLLLAGCLGPRFDPLITPTDQRRIRIGAIVTSRVVDSPYYANCRENGVAVWDAQFRAHRIGGPLMAASGKRTDEKAASALNQTLRSYDLEEILAERFYTQLSERAPYTVIGEEEVDDILGMPEVKYRIDHEIVRRKRDYRSIAREFKADVLIDLRLVEWALVYTPKTDDVKVRLRVRVKIVKYPENVLLYYNEFENEFDERRLGRSIEDYSKNYAEILRAETSLAIESLIRLILREIIV